MDNQVASDVKVAEVKPVTTVIYEFGARLDPECAEAANEQIRLARRLYNDLVASIRDTVIAMQQYVLSQSGERGEALNQELAALEQAFIDARARNDEDAMKAAALGKRPLYRELSALLKQVRKDHKDTLNQRFFSRIGKNSTCATYILRSQAVQGGLGWATANAILDAALIAFKKSFVNGRAPRFAKAAERVQDTLTLQFTVAGGVPAEKLLQGQHSEFSLVPTGGCGRRCYGEFRFRLGSGETASAATGTWQYHRPLPAKSSVGLVRLVRRRIGKDTRWAIQLQLSVVDGITMAPHERKPLVAVHFGWAADVLGRRVGAIAGAADPGFAELIKLPPAIEANLERAAALASERDKARDEVVPQIKAIDESRLPEECLEEFRAIKRLPAQHVAVSRLHRLHRLLREAGVTMDWFDAWRLADRARWQSSTHLARTARNRRRDFYRNLAAKLSREYAAIAIEPLDLAAAAEKIDKKTGERSDFGPKARAGRVVAAIYELESALRWAGLRSGAALLDVTAKTVQSCAHCGAEATETNPDDVSLLVCKACGAVTDRKLNGAAVAWQRADANLGELVEAYHLRLADALQGQEAAKEEKRQKMAAGRAVARARRQTEAVVADLPTDGNEM